MEGAWSRAARAVAGRVGSKAMANYSIVVDRQGLWTGVVRYEGSFSFSCPCWWDPGEQIPTGIYYGCSATHLATKRNARGKPREGIFLPDVPERTGIFIHYWPGTRADVRIWSDGCALLLDEDMMRIWNDIHPKDARNVTVTIQNSLPKAASYHGIGPQP